MTNAGRSAGARARDNARLHSGQSRRHAYDPLAQSQSAVPRADERSSPAHDRQRLAHVFAIAADDDDRATERRTRVVIGPKTFPTPRRRPTNATADEDPVPGRTQRQRTRWDISDRVARVGQRDRPRTSETGVQTRGEGDREPRLTLVDQTQHRANEPDLANADPPALVPMCRSRESLARPAATVLRAAAFRGALSDETRRRGEAQ